MCVSEVIVRVSLKCPASAVCELVGELRCTCVCVTEAFSACVCVCVCVFMCLRAVLSDSLRDPLSVSLSEGGPVGFPECSPSARARGGVCD